MDVVEFNLADSADLKLWNNCRHGVGWNNCENQRPGLPLIFQCLSPQLCYSCYINEATESSNMTTATATADKADNISLNNEQELYVIHARHGYSCLGFDVMLRKHAAISAWLRSEGLPADDLPANARGTIRGYKSYETAMQRASAGQRPHRPPMPGRIMPATDRLGGQARRGRVYRWNDRAFRVGKSTGWMPCHLAISRRTSSGGFAVDGPFKSVRVVNASPNNRNREKRP